MTMAQAPIRVMLVDGNALYSEAISALIGSQKDFQMAGYCLSPGEARARISKENPDVVLLELHSTDQNSFDLLRELPTLSSRTRAVATGDIESRENIVEAMRLGARGFLLKQSPAELFLKCLRKVSAGEIWLDGRFAEAVLNAFGSYTPENKKDSKNEISVREMEVIGLVVHGYKNKDIADKLFISEKTVKNHLSAIFHKVGVSDRLELTLFAFEKRLFSPNGEH
ncbi:MAG: response regulator transcription factor [Acidobacteria bacterium]|nr:response regulator transcription factor [Acidobacteriota bacterium]